MPSVLIVDDEPNIRRMVGALLSAEGYDVRDAPDGASGLMQAQTSEPDVALIDLMMPGELDGLALLARLREQRPDLPVVMMSGRAALADAVRATKLGAFTFLEKPLTPEGVLLALASAFELRQARRATQVLREDLGVSGEMIGDSPALRQVRDLIARVGPSEARVLVTGESGTGKELVAAALHFSSSRRDRPFIRVNCAAIPRDLVESEMFGHERGAFTGATDRRIGRFEMAHTGTLFLDEVGDLGAEAQAKLLRAIEAQEIERVGGGKPIRIAVRIPMVNWVFRPMAYGAPIWLFHAFASASPSDVRVTSSNSSLPGVITGICPRLSWSRSLRPCRTSHSPITKAKLGSSTTDAWISLVITSSPSGDGRTGWVIGFLPTSSVTSVLSG